MHMLVAGLHLVESCRDFTMILHMATVAYYAHVFGHATVAWQYIVCDAGAQIRFIRSPSTMAQFVVSVY